MIPVRVEKRRGLPIRWFDPFGEFDLFGEFDRLVDRLAGGRQSAWVYHRGDVWEDETNLYVEMEMPGLSAADVNVSYEDGTLRIDGEKKPPEHNGEVHLSERRFGKFARTFHLANVVDPDSIKASFKDGILTITLAKRPETRPKKIEVKVD